MPLMALHPLKVNSPNSFRLISKVLDNLALRGRHRPASLSSSCSSQLLLEETHVFAHAALAACMPFPLSLPEEILVCFCLLHSNVTSQ